MKGQVSYRETVQQSTNTGVTTILDYNAMRLLRDKCLENEGAVSFQNFTSNYFLNYLIIRK
jgi:hypothetical protein